MTIKWDIDSASANAHMSLKLGSVKSVPAFCAHLSRYGGDLVREKVNSYGFYYTYSLNWLQRKKTPKNVRPLFNTTRQRLQFKKELSIIWSKSKLTNGHRSGFGGKSSSFVPAFTKHQYRHNLPKDWRGVSYRNKSTACHGIWIETRKRNSRFDWDLEIDCDIWASTPIVGPKYISLKTATIKTLIESPLGIKLLAAALQSLCSCWISTSRQLFCSDSIILRLNEDLLK